MRGWVDPIPAHPNGVVRFAVILYDSPRWETNTWTNSVWGLGVTDTVKFSVSSSFTETIAETVLETPIQYRITESGRSNQGGWNWSILVHLRPDPGRAQDAHGAPWNRGQAGVLPRDHAHACRTRDGAQMWSPGRATRI